MTDTADCTPHLNLNLERHASVNESVLNSAQQATVKLLDFGLAVAVSADPRRRPRFTKVCGSVPFVAPEI